MRAFVPILIAAVTILSSAMSRAHHHAAAHFLLDETAVIEGVVKEFWFANPHSRLYVEVTTESGEVEEWMVELSSRNNLIRSGWSEDRVRPGTELIVIGHPSRDGPRSLQWEMVTTKDGEEIER